jgi:divalent metal cation (Fe/Co/Zn/Cd) transporter
MNRTAGRSYTFSCRGRRPRIARPAQVGSWVGSNRRLRQCHDGAGRPASHFLIGYIVLALSFVLEGISFLQSVRQAKPQAESMQRDLIEHVLVTSDPTLRAVFAEDSAALTGLLIAAASLAVHQLTGSPVPDGVGSIVIGVMLAVTAIVLINLNRRFLVGQEADPRVRIAAIQALLDAPEVVRLTYSAA